MADYTLSGGVNVVINTNTTVDNFRYIDGTIDVPPSVNFTMNGVFIFEPTASDNPYLTIYKGLVNRLELETGANGSFPQFKIYDKYPQNAALFFPCVVFGPVEREDKISQYMFGGETMETAQIVCDLAFKKNDVRTIGGIVVSGMDLANHYLTKMRDILSAISFKSDAIKIGDFLEESSVQEPTEPNQTLYGFSMEITLNYKTPTN